MVSSIAKQRLDPIERVTTADRSAFLTSTLHAPQLRTDLGLAEGCASWALYHENDAQRPTQWAGDAAEMPRIEYPTSHVRIAQQVGGKFQDVTPEMVVDLALDHKDGRIKADITHMLGTDARLDLQSGSLAKSRTKVIGDLLTRYNTLLDQSRERNDHLSQLYSRSPQPAHTSEEYLAHFGRELERDTQGSAVAGDRVDRSRLSRTRKEGEGPLYLIRGTDNRRGGQDRRPIYSSSPASVYLVNPRKSDAGRYEPGLSVAVPDIDADNEAWDVVWENLSCDSGKSDYSFAIDTANEFLQAVDSAASTGLQQAPDWYQQISKAAGKKHGAANWRRGLACDTFITLLQDVADREDPENVAGGSLFGALPAGRDRVDERGPLVQEKTYTPDGAPRDVIRQARQQSFEANAYQSAAYQDQRGTITSQPSGSVLSDVERADTESTQPSFKELEDSMKEMRHMFKDLKDGYERLDAWSVRTGQDVIARVANFRGWFNDYNGRLAVLERAQNDLVEEVLTRLQTAKAKSQAMDRTINTQESRIDALTRRLDAQEARLTRLADDGDAMSVGSWRSDAETV